MLFQKMCGLLIIWLDSHSSNVIVSFLTWLNVAQDDLQELVYP